MGGRKTGDDGHTDLGVPAILSTDGTLSHTARAARGTPTDSTSDPSQGLGGPP